MVNYQGKTYADWSAVRASMGKAAAPVVAAPLPEPAPEPPVALSAAPERPPARRQALTDRYRPRSLAALAGQPDAVAALLAFVANPYSTAFIFGGDSGTGKTSAAWALAADLGCSIDADPPEFGGVWSMPSGEQSADSLRTIWPGLWTIPFQSKDGWKVLIVNEVEQLNGAVERLWLDKLEDLPPQTVVIFTTNALASLPDRFVDRCIGGVIQFRGAADDLRESARALAASIWRAETGQDIPPDVLESVLVKATRAGRLSFRRVVQSLVPILAQKGKPCPS
jgi:hypothetical protein